MSINTQYLSWWSLNTTLLPVKNQLQSSGEEDPVYFVLGSTWMCQLRHECTSQLMNFMFCTGIVIRCYQNFPFSVRMGVVFGQMPTLWVGTGLRWPYNSQDVTSGNVSCPLPFLSLSVSMRQTTLHSTNRYSFYFNFHLFPLPLSFHFSLPPPGLLQ